jgi:hypothetical protein
MLHHAFVEEIANLQCQSDVFENKIVRLQNQSRDDTTNWTRTLDEIQSDNERVTRAIRALDDRITTTATKVVHLGEQLENVNEPRARALEALTLMQHFNEFHTEQPLESDVFTDPDRLLDSADIIHKLLAIASELSPVKYARVQQRIQHKYDRIEEDVLVEFQRTHRTGNLVRLKTIAYILVHFSRGYPQCIDAFVENLQIVSWGFCGILFLMLTRSGRLSVDGHLRRHSPIVQTCEHTNSRRLPESGSSSRQVAVEFVAWKTIGLSVHLAFFRNRGVYNV